MPSTKNAWRLVLLIFISTAYFSSAWAYHVKPHPIQTQSEPAIQAGEQAAYAALPQIKEVIKKYELNKS